MATIGCVYVICTGTYTDTYDMAWQLTYIGRARGYFALSTVLGNEKSRIP